jgi:hypothetical protein
MHSLRFRDFDNSDPKDFSKRNSSRPPGILLLLVLRLLTKSLRHLVESRICALLAPDLYARFEFLWMTVHALHQSLCTPCKGKFRVISSELRNRNRSRQCTPCVLCAHLAPLDRRETIETYPNIHSSIYS